MSVRLKTKLSLGLVFLFVVIVLFGVLGLVSVNRLSRDADLVLQNNQESLQYCNAMLRALEDIPINKDAVRDLEENLVRQERNITEPGESDATQQLRKDFEELKQDPKDPSNYPEIRQSIIRIQDLNQLAIVRKNALAQKTASSARLWLTVIFSVLTLVAFTFIFNLPDIISGPVTKLSEGIRDIANRNYSKRIRIDQRDEFGELADAFNDMAARLDAYEHSNLSQLMFEKKRIETLINQMRDGIIGLDGDRNVLFLNRVAEKLIGLKESAIRGKYAPDVALKNDLMRTLLQEGKPGEELKIFADGKENFFSRETVAVVSEGQRIGEVVVLRNITSFHETSEAKTNFIATISHELKTPISSIRMTAQLLKDGRTGWLNREQQELVAGIGEDTDRLLRITGELLNLTQAETGNIQLQIQPTRPEGIAGKAIEAVSFTATQKNVTIACKPEADLPAVQADAEKSTWVLINLLTNAIKFSEPGSAIAVKIDRKDGSVRFSVSDDGPGIPAKYLPRLFDRYFRVPESKDTGGSGLGLAISREFIEAQDGEISAESTEGHGSTFSFSLKSA